MQIKIWDLLLKKSLIHSNYRSKNWFIYYYQCYRLFQRSFVGLQPSVEVQISLLTRIDNITDLYSMQLWRISAQGLPINSIHNYRNSFRGHVFKSFT